MAQISASIFNVPTDGDKDKDIDIDNLAEALLDIRMAQRMSFLDKLSPQTLNECMCTYIRCQGNISDYNGHGWQVYNFLPDNTHVSVMTDVPATIKYMLTVHYNYWKSSLFFIPYAQHKNGLSSSVLVASYNRVMIYRFYISFKIPALKYDMGLSVNEDPWCAICQSMCW